MSLGAFFAYFNSTYGWVTPPEYNRTKGAWLEPIMPALAPHLPAITIALGIGFMAYALYCLFRYSALAKTGG